jgi:hypothetical protein
MVEHSKALELLQVVHYILFSLGDNAPKLADLLDSILVAHHKMLLLLYGACAIKIKFHLLYHIPEKLRRFGKLNCFKTERMHVVPKNLAQHCCRTEQGSKTVRENYILRRSILDAMSMGDLECTAYYLVKPKVAPAFREPLSLHVRNIGPVVHASKEMVCGSVGHLRQNDLVLFAGPPGQPAMGKIDRFCKCTSMSSPDDFFLVRYTEYAKVGDLEWAPCHALGLCFTPLAQRFAGAFLM